MSSPTPPDMQCDTASSSHESATRVRACRLRAPSIRHGYRAYHFAIPSAFAWHVMGIERLMLSTQAIPNLRATRMAAVFADFLVEKRC